MLHYSNFQVENYEFDMSLKKILNLTKEYLEHASSSACFSGPEDHQGHTSSHIFYHQSVQRAAAEQKIRRHPQVGISKPVPTLACGQLRNWGF